MSRMCKIRNMVLFTSIALMITVLEGNDNPSLAGMMSSIKELIWGKQYPIASIKGKLLFTTDRYGRLDSDGNANIGVYVLSDGKIAKIRDYAIWGRWSPNGREVVCDGAKVKANGQSVKEAITIVASNTLEEKVVTIKTDDFHYEGARLSSDGRQVLFLSKMDTGSGMKYRPHNLFAVDKNDDHLKQLTFFVNLTQSIAGFDLSPDGKKLLFTSQGDWNNEKSYYSIYLMDVDGKNLRKLTGNSIAYHPRWSPDGKYIAFCSKTGNEFAQIYIMEADGGGIRRVTTSEFIKGEPCWSPDGKMLCYVGFTHELPFAYSELFVINTDGTGESLIMKSARVGKVWATDNHPDWIY